MSLLTKLKVICLTHKTLLCIIFFSCALRLINLTLLPIFNDEAIYLDWGWRETHNAGILFYSLYDAKQPLLMWVFGLSESFLKDPLFAGRIISVLCGLFSLLGIYMVGKDIWNKSVGLLGSLFYAISPLFLFFDRQALMESAITAIGIWTFYFLLKISNKPFLQYSLGLGAILGVGFFIKSTGLIFVLSSIFCFGFLLKKSEDKEHIISSIIISYITAFIVVIPLLLQLQFWNTLGSNSRFSLTLMDYLHFPIGIWWNNILVFLGTNFFFFTPLVFATSIIGIYQLRKPNKKELLLFIWLCITIGGQILVTRNSSLRYLVSFLPLLLLFASWYVWTLPTKLKIPAGIVFVFLPLICSLWLFFSPATYILSLSKITSLAPVEYIVGQTSGYGVQEVKKFIDIQSQFTSINVAFAENTGNPESALEMYYQDNPAVTTLYLDEKLLGSAIDEYDCLDPGIPFYFISRDEQQAGLNKFLVKIKTIKSPYGSESLGIYTPKPNCTGRVAHLRMVKNNN